MGKVIGGLFTAGLGFLACLHEDTLVVVEDGSKKMKDVVIGDRVLGSDGGFHAVIHMDHGTVAPQAKRPYVQIKVGGATLVATECHPIGGKPAGMWRAGEFMPMCDTHLRVDGVSDHPDVAGWDLMLEDNVDYVVDGGFLVRSVIGSFMTWAKIKAPRMINLVKSLEAAAGEG